ncbi:MAG TPA: AraC family transcriptional regulator [Flavobacteriia bacterium]|nr:AraC family transcriptional regulator [Flavobacteriia bacterium]
MKEMIYNEIEPPTQLHSFVQSFWHFENTSSRALHYSILPDGCFDLLVFQDGNTKLTGIWNKKIDISVPKETKIFAIRFKPLAVEYLLESSIKRLLNSSIQNPKNEFVEKMTTQTIKFSEFVAANASKIITILSTGKRMDTRKEKVFDLLFSTNGVVKVSEISEKSCWSSRQINRYFTAKFGLSTKQYANILKVFSTYTDLAKGIVYPQTSYFDQSHFIKEIKKHTETNPKELKKNKNGRFLQLYTQRIK